MGGGGGGPPHPPPLECVHVCLLVCFYVHTIRRRVLFVCTCFLLYGCLPFLFGVIVCCVFLFSMYVCCLCVCSVCVLHGLCVCVCASPISAIVVVLCIMCVLFVSEVSFVSQCVFAVVVCGLICIAIVFFLYISIA